MYGQETCELLISSDASSFEEFYCIYMESMPLRERKPRAQISAMTTRPDYKIFLVKRNGGVIGFSILFIPIDASFCLLEYMAVHIAYRNTGVGGKLFRCSVQSVISERGSIPVLLEIDSDCELSPDQAIRRKRKRFYKRLGCLQIDRLSYLLPLPGQGQPPKMELMVYLPDRSSPILKSQLEQWLRVIFQKVYNCAADDPRITLMMEPVTDPIKFV